MELGQRAFIRLEAFPGPVFHGQVADLAPMATPQPGAPDIHVFEMLIDIEEQDERLKPGMSAEVEIVLETLPDALAVPRSALFEKGDKTIVYRLNGRAFEPVEVEPAQRNATSVVIAAGLRAGDTIALKDPTLN
jgi:multidrug efflux pump subunit AcrA (membrane-fusion protein)